MTELEIASYIDRGLSDRDRDRVEDHLVEYAECRDGLMQAQVLVDKTGRPQRFLIGAGVLAAAAALLFVVRMPTSPETEPRQRSPVIDQPGIIARGPMGGVAASGKPVFAWSQVADAVSYHLTVSSMAGDSVWAYSGNDTLVVLPASVQLTPGVAYLWVTDAILANGSTRSTGLKQFELVR
jgi:hypothetical protein